MAYRDDFSVWREEITRGPRIDLVALALRILAGLIVLAGWLAAGAYVWAHW